MSLVRFLLKNGLFSQGGKDLRKRSRMLEREGEEVSGSMGYKYFGAARELPGVRELFDAAPAEATKKTR